MKTLKRLIAWFMILFGKPKALEVPQVARVAELPATPPTPPKGRLAYGLKAGFAWNPVKNFPRNLPCVCGSGKKFKSCHLNQLPPVCRAEDESKLQDLVRLAKAGKKFKVQLRASRTPGENYDVQSTPGGEVPCLADNPEVVA